MAEFHIPEDISGFTDDELSNLLSATVAEFETQSASTSVTTDDLETLRGLAVAVERMRAEQSARLEAAEAAATEIDALMAQVRGTPAEEATEEPAEEPAAATSEEPEAAPAQEPEAEPVTAAAVVPARPALDLTQVRRRQQHRVIPAEPARPVTRFSASVDVPGHKPGSELAFADLTAGTIARANALAKTGGGSGLVASYSHPFTDDLIVNDPGSAPEGTTVSLTASSQRRLPQGDLVASGGWCAPSETVYDIAEVACPDMLWDAPEVQLARGGIRFFKTPSLDVAALTWVHTEADDIGGRPKPCFKIPCPEPTEARCDAIGICIEAGILTQRHFPELVSHYLAKAIIAHEIRLRTELLAQVAVAATPVPVAQTWGAIAPVFAAVALQAADMVERHSLCDSISLEAVFPWWSKNLFLADLARRNGVSLEEVTTADVQDVFSPLGVRVQWARGIVNTLPEGTPPVNVGIGGATPALVWPDEIQFLLYPAGQIQIGRGAEVNLGVVHDSTKFRTNDYTAAWSEECVTIVDRSVDTRLVTVPVCPSGQTGAQTLLTCPAA